MEFVLLFLCGGMGLCLFLTIYPISMLLSLMNGASFVGVGILLFVCGREYRQFMRLRDNTGKEAVISVNCDGETVTCDNFITPLPEITVEISVRDVDSLDVMAEVQEYVRQHARSIESQHFELLIRFLRECRENIPRYARNEFQCEELWKQAKTLLRNYLNFEYIFNFNLGEIYNNGKKSMFSFVPQAVCTYAELRRLCRLYTPLADEEILNVEKVLHQSFKDFINQQ